MKLTKEGERIKEIVSIVSECRAKIGSIHTGDIAIIGTESWNMIQGAFEKVHKVEDYLKNKHQ